MVIWALYVLLCECNLVLYGGIIYSLHRLRGTIIYAFHGTAIWHYMMVLYWHNMAVLLFIFILPKRSQTCKFVYSHCVHALRLVYVACTRHIQRASDGCQKSLFGFGRMGIPYRMRQDTSEPTVRSICQKDFLGSNVM